MNLPGQTPLTLTAIDDEQRQLLRSLWIESAEEAIAAACAVDSVKPGGENAGLRALATSTDLCAAIEPTRLSQLQTVRPGGTLGCLVEDQTLEDFRRLGRLREERASASGAFGGQLPKAVRLIDRLPPIRNQGDRGTCVAFGVTALREFLLGSRDDLSEQFLYWACKELDGHPGAGTYVHTAMSALAQYGVCLEAAWPYNPRQTRNEGQGPPPPGARKSARSYQLSSSRTVEPNLVLHYKHVLAGDNGANGMPVAFGTLVFNSWYRSAETRRTGKITLPFPDESYVGGHAWCIVGYVDDVDVPGGGYFIVRNSWGTDWASECPEGAGHALMPYEYVERYAKEAFTGPLDEAVMATQGEGGTLDQCLRVLSQDEHEELEGRPHRGRLLMAGTSVLMDRFSKDVFRQTTDANLQKFSDRDCTWIDDSWRKAWFLELGRFSSEAKSLLDSARGAREKFISAIQENILSSTGAPFPNLRTPWWTAFLPFDWEPKTRSVGLVADLTEALAGEMAARSGTPAGLAWPDNWKELLADLNRVEVYEVRSGRKTAHILLAFLAPMEITRQASPTFVPLDQSMLDALHRVYSAWRETIGSLPCFSFLTIGTIDRTSSSAAAVAAGDHWFLLSVRDPSGGWQTSVPERFGDRISISDFVDLLKPETALERVARIKTCVDELILQGGNVTAMRVKECTAGRYRKSVIRRAFFTLQSRSTDDYRVYRTKDGHYAITRSTPGEEKRVAPASLRPGVMQQHGWRMIGAAVSFAGLSARNVLGIRGIGSIVLAVLILYLTSCIQGVINRRADNYRE